MNKFKNDITKMVLCGVAIFVFGIFIGYQLNNGAIASIQGFLFNAASYATDSNATNSNATNTNATNSNATNANATNSNATNSNATDSNASLTNNIIYLQNLQLKTEKVKAGEKVYIDLYTSGACNSGASIVFRSAVGTTFIATVESIGDNPYIIVPKNAVASSYNVTDVLLIGRNNDNTTFTKMYSVSGDNIYNFDVVLMVEKEESNNNQKPTKVVLNNISLETNKANVSDKVFVNVDSSEKLSSLKLTFASSDNKQVFNVYVKSLYSNPYFEIPTTTQSGMYSLTGATLISSSSTTIYSKTGGNYSEKFAFNSLLEVSDKNANGYIYNNEDINSDIITQLYNTDNGTEIIVNADSNSIINGELFNVIKGKDKTLTINYEENQIVFKGRDITSSKTIDVRMVVDSIDSNLAINKLVSYGIIVKFADNGNLPGKALIRVKATDNVIETLNSSINVYFYNEQTNNFTVVQTNVKKTEDDYYEFTITHNSNYLLVNHELDSKLVVSQNPDNIVSFQKGNKVYLLLIGVGVLAAIATTVIIIIIKKKKSNNLYNNYN